MSINRSVIFSPTITPPIPRGQKFKSTAMTPFSYSGTCEELVKDHIVIVNREDKDGYRGIYTTGLYDCIGVTILERNGSGVVQSILMIHFDGGINQRRIDGLIQFLFKRSLETNGYREIIFTLGHRSQAEAKLWFENERYALDKREVSGVENYFAEYPGLTIRSCFYSSNKTSNSACVTLDGYAGPFYGKFYTKVLFSERKDSEDMVFEGYELPKEQAEFKTLKEYILQKEDKKPYEIFELERVIEKAACSSSVKAELYFLTREIIFNKEFNKSFNDVLFTQYQQKVKKLPLYSSKAVIFTAVTSLIGIGLFTSLPYFFYKKHKRENAFIKMIELQNSLCKKI